MRNFTRVLVAAALAASASMADAKPRKVVVLDFDGPRALADLGRSNVMSLLGDQYDVVSTKRWEAARAQAQGHGPQQWSQAAKQSGVDAVIEGWVQDEGRHHTLTIAVREAATGTEIDTFSVKLGDKGVGTDATRTLSTQLDDVLAWIDGDATASQSGAQLPDVRTVRPMLGAHQAKPDRHDDDDEAEADADADDDRPQRHRRRHHRHRLADDDRGERGDRSERRRSRDDDDDRDARPSRRDRDRDRDDDKAERSDKPDKDAASKDDKPKADPKQVALADPASQSTSDLVNLFGPDPKDTIPENKPPRVVKPAPRFALAAGGFIASRGMSFTKNPPDATSPTPDYPASGLYGLALSAAVYPMPINKLDNQVSGIGFSFDLSKSVGAYMSAQDPSNNSYGDYTIDHTAYEGAIHYRYPIDFVSVDGELDYGKFSYAIADLPGTVPIPDVDYSYVGLGGHVDVAVTDRARVGFGARYMYLLSAGDVSDQMWYGAGTASGLELDANVEVPVGDLLFLRGDLTYRRVALDFEQSGDVSNADDISSIVDSTIAASAKLGVHF